MTYDEEFIEFFKRFELVITGNNDYMLESGYEGDDLEYDHIMMEVYLDEMYAERMGINQVEGWREDYYWDLLWLSEECLPQITFDKDQTVWGRFAGGKTVRKFVGALFPGAVLVDDYLTREDERLAEMFGYTVIRAPRGGEGLMGLVELVDEALK